MRVEIIYAPSDRTWVRRAMDLADGATVAIALEASGLLRDFPQIDFGDGYGLAIYGTQVGHAKTLKCGDRLEILRPLKVDPKEARRARARKRAWR